MNPRRALAVTALAAGALYVSYLSMLFLTQGALIYPGTRNHVDPVAPQPEGAELFHIATSGGTIEALFLARIHRCERDAPTRGDFRAW
jgi:hypothetical protein